MGKSQIKSNNEVNQM